MREISQINSVTSYLLDRKPFFIKECPPSLHSISARIKTDNYLAVVHKGKPIFIRF